MQHQIARIVALACWVASLSGCAYWEVARGPVPTATAHAAGKSRGRPVRLELTSGAVTTVFDATVRGDSVVGTLPLTGSEVQRAPVAYALSDIRRVEYSRIQVGETVEYYLRWGFGLFGVFLVIGFVTFVTTN